MRSNNAAVLVAGLLLAVVALSCGKSQNDRRGAPSPSPVAAKPAHWEVAYQSPLSLNQPEVPLWSFNSISVVSPSVIFVAADYPTPGNMDKRVGYIVRTTDGGANWTEAPLEPKGIDLAGLNAIKFVNPSSGCTVGVDESGYAILFNTSDGGQTWTATRTSFKQSPTSVFLNNDRGWVGCSTGTTEDPDVQGGPSDILATTNAGSTWSPQYHLPVSINDLSFVDDSTGWAAGIPASIYHTTDGRIWSPQQTNLESTGPRTPDQFAIRRVDFVDPLHGWAAAANGALIPDQKRAMVLGSVNGGTTWTPLWLLQGEALRELHFLNQQEGWATTENGEYIYHTVDGGHTWLSEPIKFPVRVTFYRIGATDASHVWAVGGGAIIRRVEE